MVGSRFWRRLLHVSDSRNEGELVVNLLCTDCLLEDRKEEPAVTVTNGFALCHKHLFRFYSKVLKSQENASAQLSEYLDWEASIDRTKSSGS